MKLNKRQKIVLAAFLHDIGKFYERSDESYRDSVAIKQTFPDENFEDIAPVDENKEPKYRHSLWTYAFLNSVNLTDDKPEDLNEFSFAMLAASHHKPENLNQGILSLADKWSSAINRSGKGEESFSEEMKNRWNGNLLRYAPLQNIFHSLSVNGKHGEAQNYFKLAPLDAMKRSVLFPATEKGQEKSLPQQYKEMWAMFVKEFDELTARCTEFDSFYISLTDLVRKYTWCIPALSNSEHLNISLYEHLKTTAGIALCLYDYYSETGEQPNYHGIRNDAGEKESLILVCIDITGIQKFIYDIANKKAAKSLKGRSFYLQLLMQVIIDLIIRHKDIDVQHTNVVYASGGKAYLLLPKLDRVEKALAEVDRQVQDMLRNDFGGKVYAVFGRIAFHYESLYDEKSGLWTNTLKSNDITEAEKVRYSATHDGLIDLGGLWGIVADRASRNKFRKFKTRVLAYDEIFTSESYHKDSQKCAVTGERGEKLIDLNDGRGAANRVLVLPSVYAQTKLGEDLKNGRYLLSFKSEDQGDLKDGIQVIDTYYKVLENTHDLDLGKASLSHVHLRILNENKLPGKDKLNNIAVSTMFYGGNRTPELRYRAKTFEELAKTAEGNSTKLAVLRMDIDNLGQLFISGFDGMKQSKSFAGYSTLSFMLELFFCGYINQIQQSNDEYKNHVQILYSGGDDLFAVGRWDCILVLARDVRNEFARFAGRQDITLSAGVSIVGAKYPISKSAELSGEAEKAANAFNGFAKNAINIFGQTVSWNREFDFVQQYKNSFVYFDGIINRALLHQIQKYKLLKDAGVSAGTNDISYKWNSVYTLSRALERMKDRDIVAEEFIDKIRRNIIQNTEYGPDRYLDLVALGARWAEYIIKQNKND